MFHKKDLNLIVLNQRVIWKSPHFCLQYTRALLVLQQCMRLSPRHPIVYLHAARICYEHLNMVRLPGSISVRNRLFCSRLRAMKCACGCIDHKYTGNELCVARWKDCIFQYEEGLDYVKTVLELGEDQPMASKCFVALGIGYSLQAEEARLKSTRQDLQRKALNAFNR